PLNNPRERASNAQLKTPQTLRSAAWMPWVASWEETMIPTQGEALNVQNGLLCAYAQPILSKISFAGDGSITLGLMDRWAHQTGHLNYSTRLGDRTLVIGYAAGDLIKVFRSANGLYIVEQSNSDDGIYYRKDDGPSYHGEFYYEENFISPLAHHGEIVTGGQAILPGSNTVAVTVHSPIVTKNPYFQYDGLLTQGLHFYDMNTGKRTGEYLFVEQFVLGKANGLGDIAIAEDAAPPAVGNYVWCDANGNGIQDPTEYGMDGIEVSLHDEENALVALSQKTTTDGGQYYFDNLLPNHLYELRIDLDQLINKGYSGVASPLHSRSSLIDSDGDDVTLPGYAIIEFMTGNDGQNRDDLDFGFLGPLALDAQKILCENVSILPPNLPCADFSLADVKSCATSSSTNTVQIFPSFDDAEDRTREILNDIRVCGMDSIVFARVSVSGDPNCFAISRIDLMVQPGAGGLIVDFVEIVCPSDPFDLLAYLQSQGFRGDQTTQFYTDPAHMMTYMGDPMSVLPSSFPFILYYDDTIVEGGCGVPGSITLIEIPETEIFAGNDTSLCGLDCIDLTLLQPYFYANGTGATEAIWTSSGTGIFVDDATFANAHFYCPDANDLAAGQVVLSLTVTDDPCAVVAPSSSVLIYLTAGTPSFLEVPRDTIDCYHPFAIDPASFDTFPGCQLVLECIDTLVGEVVDYEIILGDCENIIKQVKRTLRFQYEKEEYFCMDTITVRALPDTVICPPIRDSVYCVPGYLKDENGHPSPMQTGVPMAGEVPLWPPLPSDCDILVTYKDVEFGGICPATIRREWLIKNSCTGAFDSCTQWIMIFDTTAPVITKLDTAAFITPIPSGSHHCEAEIRVPGIMVEDTCSGVKQVKGMINGQVIELVFNSISGYYESPVLIKVPVSEIDPLHDYYNISYVSYEVIDSCHNRSLVDSLPLYVVDKTKPVAICDKGLNITVADSTVWLPVSIFDEGSWDNCGIGLLLARRVDWATACGMNLCDSLLFVGIDEHHDSLFTAVLEENRHLNPLEAHYSETIKWLCEQGGICSYPVLLGWAYDLMRYAVKDCREHPYAVNDQYIQDLIRSWLPNVDSSLWLATVFSCLDTNSTPIYGSTPGLNDAFVVGLNETLSLTDIYEKSSLLDLGVKLGGGWSAKVPFCCEDACQDIMVELLVMDYWCNWSKCWTTVRVEDKTPPIVINDLADVSITCSAYEQFYASSVHLAQQGIFDSLQIKLGGYDHISKRQSTTVGVDNYQLLNLVCDSVLVTYDSLVYDEHAGYVWKTYQSYQTEYRQETDTRFRGQVADNCGLISWEENPWISLDDCGTGFIKRTFKFVGQCGSGTSGHVIDTISRQQIIWVTNDCVLSKSMFNFPKDTVVNSCEIEFSDDGSGNVGAELSPDFLGRATYLLSADCRRVGIGYYDKVFKIVGGNQACYKILRTWCLADWCLLASSEKEGWWFEKQYAGKYLSYTQKIIVVDSTAPICNILDLPGEVYTHGCDYTIEARLAIEAYCGSVDYRWQILNQKTQLVVGKGMGSSNTVEQGIIIEAESLEPGDYLLKAVVVDDCQNESWCQQEFKVISNNKPTPVCVTSISVELTPMDTNGDGLVDTAMAIIMASDFNQSSLPACGSSVSGLQYRIDFAHIDPMLPGSDAHQISLGCLHIGVNALHLFVIDENGQWDYCSVNVVVQPNMGGCTDDIIGGVKGNTSNIPVKVNATDFQLHQNVPNPFHGETTIGFNVSRNGVARLSIFDVHGRILYDRSDMASTGYNEWKITGLSNFDVSALLYYKLEYQDRVAVRKMLLLR
ncbi:MAG: hypothetical protein KDC53_04800, partial [Saprospiraceae bacterium]|nr:hypothetical protein [Saprospiraceae bacterium]